MRRVVLLVALISLMAGVAWGDGFERKREKAGSAIVVSNEGMDVVVLEGGELVRNAADWVSDFVRRNDEAGLNIGGAELLKSGRTHLVTAVGDDAVIKELAGKGEFKIEGNVGEQGYVIQRVKDERLGEMVVCWSPGEIGCRYGVIDLLRGLKVQGKKIVCDAGLVVDRPTFPVRIAYVNFAEHLQNAFNPNVLFETQVNRWSMEDWKKFIDMISSDRYNVFEFWLVPTLFSPEAIAGGKIQGDFARTMNEVAAYAKTRGVRVHPIITINTVGAKWHFDCPNDPKEKAEILSLWDWWSKKLDVDSMGFFPGDPGGCTRNGCTAETYVDLCLDVEKVVRKNKPGMGIEIGTWGEPMAGWGVPIWTGDRARAVKAMNYLIGKLPEFGKGVFTSINMGFSPDCLANQNGGDGTEFAKRVAKTNQVLTWDYSVSEGEGTVSPRCRVRRMVERRREEMAVGCYSGGICYTMAPRLNFLNLFAAAESFWNPEEEAGKIMEDFGRITYGEELAKIGPLMEEFEVVPDWGFYPSFKYSPGRLKQRMAELKGLLERIDPRGESRLPLATGMREHRGDLLFFADLFEKLATVELTLEEMKPLAMASGKIGAGHKGLVSLEEAESLLNEPGEFPKKAELREVAKRLEALDARGLMRSYWARVYGIYDVVPHPVDPRAEEATKILFNRFNGRLAYAAQPTVLDGELARTGKAFEVVHLGRESVERGWRLSGWTAAAEDGGEMWRASFAEPGMIARDDFVDRGYRWLVVRLTEGPAGGRKKMMVNGREVGEFVRTGPAVTEKKEWWVTRSFAIPEGVLRNGKLEIRLSEPGIAISEVGLSVGRVADTR